MDPESLEPFPTGAAIDTIVVAYRSDDVIEAALRAVRPLNGQVVVVDHYDGEAGWRAARLGAGVVHDPSNPGFGAGQNRGVALTTSPYVLLCNPDAMVDPKAVRLGAALLAARPEVAAVQGVIMNQATGRPERSQGLEVRPVHLLGRALGAGRLVALAPMRWLARRSIVLRDHGQRVPMAPTEVESLAATAVLVRRSAFGAVGGFDPSYFLYGEDMDLCRRLRQAGWRLVAMPGVWATHCNGASATSPWERELHWWQGTMSFGARWWGAGAWSLALFAAVLRCARLCIGRPRRAGDAIFALVRRPIHRRRSDERRQRLRANVLDSIGGA